MEAFFFIPASKLMNFSFVQSLGVEEIIIDFEDAIIKSQRSQFFKQLEEGHPKYCKCWVRVPVYDENSAQFDFGFIDQFVACGYSRFVLPKLTSSQAFLSVAKHLLQDNPSIEIILLVEHPRLLIELKEVLQSPYEKSIVGLALGSHDLLSMMGAEHSPEQAYFPRMQVLYGCKAYGKISIDIASMNIGDKERFDQEVESGVLSGYDAKFILHPKQLTWLKENKVIELRAIDWANRIITALPGGLADSNVEPFILGGDIIEKPHIEKAISIIKKYGNEK